LGLTTSRFGAIGSFLGLERPRRVAKSKLEERDLTTKASTSFLEFAAALITLTSSERDHSDHVEKALAGAKTASYLSSH